MKKRADGRYQRKITLPDGTQKHVYGTSPAEVNRKAKEIERAFETGIDLSDRTTVAQWATKWVQEYKSGLRENTQRSILRNLNLHILPVLGNMRMQDVKEVHCRAVMNPISKYSEDLQRKVLNILHQLFKTAIANGIVAKNPTENLEITPHAKPENQTQFLTTEQQRELLSRVTEPRARAFCALMLFCGLRREEALGVLWTDIEGNKLHVRRSLTFPVNQPDENRELKTTKANRAIPIPQRLKDILDETPKTALQIGTERTRTRNDPKRIPTSVVTCGEIRQLPRLSVHAAAQLCVYPLPPGRRRQASAVPYGSQGRADDPQHLHPS